MPQYFVIVVFFVKSNENTYPKGRALNANVQSCPYNEKSEFVNAFIALY